MAIHTRKGDLYFYLPGKAMSILLDGVRIERASALGPRDDASKRLPLGKRELRLSIDHRHNQGPQNHCELDREEYWNYLMQGAHSNLPPSGRDAFELPVARSRFRRSLVLSAGAMDFMNIF